MSDYDNWKCDDSAYRQDAPDDPGCPADVTGSPVDCDCGGAHGRVTAGVGRAHELQSLRKSRAAIRLEMLWEVRERIEPCIPVLYNKTVAKVRAEFDRMIAEEEARS